MAAKRTTIPIPPSQWVILLQRSIYHGVTERSVMTVAPVVVKPEEDSKKASIKLSKVPDIR
jgi:hypothetical protein